MSATVLVVAPHPDDETLGCGGTLLRHVNAGDCVHWLICTEMRNASGYTAQMIATRDDEIAHVANEYKFESVWRLGFPAAQLDQVGMQNIVSKMREALQVICPEIVYLPHRGDVHTDHRYVFDSAVSAAKPFRSRSVRRVLSYETLSETEQCRELYDPGFRPQVYMGIEKFLDQKVRIMQIYSGEMAPSPFPRSEEAIRSLAHYRGVASGSHAAEAFMLLYESL